MDDRRSYERRVAQSGNLGFVTTPEISSWNAPAAELAPDQAPRVFEETVQLLNGNPSDEELLHALRSLRAACDADSEKACEFLREQGKQPVKLEGAEVVHPTGEPGFIHAEYAVVILVCQLDVDGHMHGCQVVESGPGRYAEQLIAQISAYRYAPWTLAGHPMRSPYNFSFNLWRGSGYQDLSTEKKLEWARLRVGWSPTSTSAWTNLAAQLAVHAPEHPHYARALARAHALAPHYWWTATEMAWQRTQQGQHADALMALRPVLRRSTMGKDPNPYVLETAAAAHFGLKQCTEALAEQRKAVELLPEDWLSPEKKRFQRKLQEYQTACAPPSPVAP